MRIARPAPRALRQRLAQRELDQAGPWETAFEVDGATTGGHFDYADDIRVREFQRLFPSPGRILELGSFEGGHTVQLARNATEVVGIEARRESIARAELITRLLGIDNVRFVEANLETRLPSSFGRFDVVFCSGLVYHLPRPWELLRDLPHAAPAAFIWTHHSATVEITFDGWKGCWFEEGGLPDPLSGVSPRSFWLTLEELQRALAEGGFETCAVVERFEDWGGQGPAVLLAAWADDQRRRSSESRARQ